MLANVLLLLLSVFSASTAVIMIKASTVHPVLLASLAPRRDARSYVFVTMPVAPPDVDTVATVHEEEGVTLVVEQRTADEHG